MDIYKITNLINGKIYIGKENTYDSDYLGSGLIINRAIKKYGRENFKKDVIDTADTLEDLNEKEIYWIKEYDSINNKIGYNIMIGGDGGDNFTNHPNKEEIRKKFSLRSTGSKNPMFGKKHSKKSIEQISKNRKGKGKGISTWNKNKSTKNYSEKYKAYYDKKIRGVNIKTKCKTYICISPSNIKYEINGSEFKKFLNEHELYCSMVWHFVNTGIIKAPQKGKPKQERLNLVGWDIKRIEIN